MTSSRQQWWIFVVGVALCLVPRLRAANETSAFLQKYCYDCHDSEGRKAGLDLEHLSTDFAKPDTFAEWVKIHDRVAEGEMPPARKARPQGADLSGFTNALSSLLLKADQERVAREGRATKRRLNRYEYEETLRDLLSLPYLEVKNFLPEDTEAHGFNKVGDALDVSHVQMARYLAAGEFALRQAVAPQLNAPKRETRRFYTWDEGEFFGRIKLEGPLNRRTFPLVGLELQRDLMAAEHPKRPETSDEETREKQAMGVVVSTYEPTEIRFGKFRAPVAGKYRLRFCGYSIWMGPKFTEVTESKRSEPVTIYAETPPRSLRKLGSFDFQSKPTVTELEAYLLAGETIRPDAARLFRSRPPDHKNPMATPEGMPGVAFGWMEVDGPIVEEWPPAGHQLLFGDLPLADNPPILTTNRAGVVRQRPGGVQVVSESPEKDAQALLRKFLDRAYRRPVEAGEEERFAGIVRYALGSGYNFTEAMIAGYTAVLCSPGFLYFQGTPGALDDWALAERLSYFLWNSAPDETLRQLAKSGELHRPDVLKDQTERLLRDPRAERFIEAYLDYWLDLRLIAGAAPDEILYPDYQLDDLLSESMIGESQAFFAELIQRNLGVTNLIASDFAMLNERLATHYGIEGVDGVALRAVPLPSDSVRGGFLTQASVLKVTANGTSTSPVKRGVWIMTRLLGQPPPPPPPNLPAVDPDIRGATTIREQLAKHRSQESCNACHRKIDPAGFALESFDVMGAWRERYRSAGAGEPVKGIGHNGVNYHFSLGPKVDPSGEMPNGEPFEDVRQLKRCLLQQEEQLARNLVEQLTVYSTGAPIGFADRPKISTILAQSRESGYGVRTIIHQLVQSDLFTHK